MDEEERQEVGLFNTELKALPTRTLPKDRYEPISLEVLNSTYKCCFLEFVDEAEVRKHALYGKRLVMQGMLLYRPTDFENREEETSWLELQNTNDDKNMWHVDADLALDREERAFIKSHCKVPLTLDGCAGQFYGVIGRIAHYRGLEVLGLHIEYMTAYPRKLKRCP